MIIILKVLETEPVLFEGALMVFKIFSCLFVKEIQIEVSACVYEITYYSNCQFPSSIPIQSACSGFLIAACVAKSCCETRL
jgi:hypothetical protein